MQTLHNSHSTRITNTEDPKPKKRFPFAYIVLVLSFCTFAGSIWFSSYQEGCFATTPTYERQKRQVQDEIHRLELEESTLTGVQRIRQIATELGMVEPTQASQIVWDK